MTSVIYKIENKKNNKIYIGKSKNVNARWRNHKHLLRNNRNSFHLQNAWNKYGEENFQFEIIEECENEKLKEREEYWINYYQSYDRERGYNIERYSKEQVIVSEETIEKIRNARFKQVLPKEAFEKQGKWMSENRCGEDNPNSKLTWEDVREIREKYIPFVCSQFKLAKEYNVSRSSIEDILHNRTWIKNKKGEVDV